VDPSNVEILSIEPARRRAGIKVDVAVAGANPENLSADNINQELKARGLPEATVTVVSGGSTSLQIPVEPVATTPPPVEGAEVVLQTTIIAVASVLGALVLCMVLGVWLYIRMRYSSTKQKRSSSKVVGFHDDRPPTAFQVPVADSSSPWSPPGRLVVPGEPDGESAASRTPVLGGVFSPLQDETLPGAPAISAPSPRIGRPACITPAGVDEDDAWIQYELFCMACELLRFLCM